MFKLRWRLKFMFMNRLWWRFRCRLKGRLVFKVRWRLRLKGRLVFKVMMLRGSERGSHI